jgi:hypothetical protein
MRPALARFRAHHDARDACDMRPGGRRFGCKPGIGRPYRPPPRGRRPAAAAGMILGPIRDMAIVGQACVRQV